VFTPFCGDPRTVRRPDYAPRSKRPCYDVYRVEPSKAHDLVVLSHVLVDVLVHPVDGRTQPCTGHAETCWLSHAEFATRWQGWLFVATPHSSIIRMVTVTPFTVEVEPELLNPARDLRGLELRLWRADKRIRSRLHGAFNRLRRWPEPLPPLPDMLTQLGSLWSAPARPANAKDCPESIREIRARYAAHTATK
jgi:hypothetical protein